MLMQAIYTVLGTAVICGVILRLGRAARKRRP
jgi:hypothetical protein